MAEPDQPPIRSKEDFGAALARLCRRAELAGSGPRGARWLTGRLREMHRARPAADLSRSTRTFEAYLKGTNLPPAHVLAAMLEALEAGEEEVAWFFAARDRLTGRSPSPPEEVSAEPEAAVEEEPDEARPEPPRLPPREVPKEDTVEVVYVPVIVREPAEPFPVAPTPAPPAPPAPAPAPVRRRTPRVRIAMAAALALLTLAAVAFIATRGRTPDGGGASARESTAVTAVPSALAEAGAESRSASPGKTSGETKKADPPAEKKPVEPAPTGGVFEAWASAQSGECLGAPGGDGAWVVQSGVEWETHCTGGHEQWAWVSGYGPDGTGVKIVNAASGMCLDVESMDLAATVVQRPCRDSGGSQVWTGYHNTTSNGWDYVMLIRNQASGYCVDNHSTNTDGQSMWQAHCNDQALAQMFRTPA